MRIAPIEYVGIPLQLISHIARKVKTPEEFEYVLHINILTYISLQSNESPYDKYKAMS